MRRRFELCVYGYVVMPEHVHLLLSEPPRAKLAEAIHYLKLSFAKRMRSRRSPDNAGTFWQKRYHDRNVRDHREFVVKLRYLAGWPGLRHAL
jgi:putative transposase